MAERWAVSVNAARNRLARLDRAGRLEQVGYRKAGKSREKVFRLLPAAKGKPAKGK